MKMTLQRPTAGTVPRKLEPVNICGVGNDDKAERFHTVSQHRPALLVWLHSVSDAQQPPFWELERLIDCGIARDHALVRLAARRSLTDRATLADGFRSPLHRPLTRDAAHG
jgi:hypothetical protein